MSKLDRNEPYVRAIVYVTIACLAVVAITMWNEFTSRNAALERAKVMTRSMAAAISLHAEETLALVEHHLVHASRGGPEVRTEATADPGLLPVAGYDADGQMLWSTPDAPAALAAAPPEVIDRHAAADQMTVTWAPGTASVPGTSPVMLVSRGFSGPAGGFAIVVIPPQSFLDMFAALASGAGVSIALLTVDGGSIVQLSPAGSRAAPQLAMVNEAIASARSETLSDAIRVTPANGAALLAGYSASSKRPVIAVVAQSESAALAEWQAGLPMRSGLSVAMLALLGFGGYRLAVQLRQGQLFQEKLAVREAELRHLAESAPDPVERFTADGTRIFSSPAMSRLSGYSMDELLGKNAIDLVHPDDIERVRGIIQRLIAENATEETISCRIRRRDGTAIWVETSLRRSGDNTIVAISRDVTERHELEDRLERMALLDGLTGLANRRAFDNALGEHVQRARRSKSPLALLMIDADRFKRFNDEYGHLAGDTCLKAVAAAVAMSARRPSDLAARYGGEEIALLLPDTRAEDARKIAIELTRRVHALGIPHERNIPWGLVTISVGVGVIGADDTDLSHDGNWLISSADFALYNAKGQGRNQAVGPLAVTPASARLAS